VSPLGQLFAEPFRLGEVNIADWKLVPVWQLRRGLTRQLTSDLLPLPLRQFVFGHPKALGQRHFDPILVRTPFLLIRWASHEKPAGRAPAKRDASNCALIPGFEPAKRNSFALRTLASRQSVLSVPVETSDQTGSQNDTRPENARVSEQCLFPCFRP
jgi:hypothetical protein